jgi:arylsulfatase A-like enzyme
VDCFDPHEPWDPPQEYVDRYDAGYTGEKLFYPRYAAADLYSERELKHMRALYAAEVTLVDRWLGHLLDAIDALGLREETALFFLSDHGFLLGEHGLVGKSGRHSAALRGWPLYAELTAIPMMARIPGIAPRRCDAFVHPGDLMPTILDLAGVSCHARVQAPSLVPLLRGEVPSVREFAVSSWSLRTVSRYRPSTLWTEEWSLLFWRSGIPPELYHLPSDAGQRRNVYTGHRSVARELHREYVSLLRSLETPAVNYWPRRFLFTLPGANTSGGRLYPGSRGRVPEQASSA